MAKYVINEEQHGLIVRVFGLVCEQDVPEEDPFKDLTGDEVDKPIKGKHPKDLLKFSTTGNAKIAHPSFSIPAGHTCPYAKECHSRADRETGKIQDDENIRFRCFSATQESAYKNLRKMRWHNYDLLQSKGNNVQELADLIDGSYKHCFPEGVSIMRLHIGGDFYSNAYFAAWLEMLRRHPELKVYAYTKSLPFWLKHKEEIPSNLILTASKGGHRDDLIDTEKWKSAEVVFSPEDAEAKGLPVDHDDSHALSGDKPFALTVHGFQPAGSDADKARRDLAKRGIGGYNRKKKKLKEGKTYLLTEYQAFLLLNS